MADGLSPVEPEITGGQGNNTNSDASESLNRSSITLDTNSGCMRLSPILSWNYFSVLNDDSFWYERGTGPIGAEGDLRKGNSFVCTQPPTLGSSSPTENTPGEPSTVQPNIADPDPNNTFHNMLINFVYGLGEDANRAQSSWVDQQSRQADNQRRNCFLPTNIDNAWREMQTTEFASISDTDTVPDVLIRTNLDYFKCGTDPATISDPVTKYQNMNANLSSEYIITSVFTLPENASFAITFKTYFFNKTSGSDADPTGKSYFRLYWGGKYLFQFNGEDAQFCPDTATFANDPTQWKFFPISGLKLTTRNNKELITLIFEVIGNDIVISNAINVGDHDRRDKRPSWSFKDLQNFDPNVFGITVAQGPLVIGVRAMDIAWSYIPVVYPPQGSLIVKNEETGYSIAELSVGNIVDTTDIMGGSIDVEPNIIDETKGSFGYSITIARDAMIDKTPALFSVELKARPTYTSISVEGFDTTNRVRKIDARLGVESQSGSITIEDRDGSIAQAGGILPCEIFTGWAETGVNLIFSGFITDSTSTKLNNQDFVTFGLTGKDLILKDAIAVNLPIYDGWDAGDAVSDLLERGGWNGNGGSNIGSGFQLPVSINPPAPIFMFPLGKSIMDCIRDIAAYAGYWAFVDNYGVFNFIEMNPGYGSSAGTFRELPTVEGYDEWQTLSGPKDTADSRNAALVVGLKLLDDDIPIPIAAVRTDDGGAVGNYLSDTIIPWLRWTIRQDPKINTEEAAQRIAEIDWQNNNRMRIGISGSIWGNPAVVPWTKLGVDLLHDQIGIPGGAQWRVISALHSADADTGDYKTIVECEYVDPRYTYQVWWEQ